MIPISLDTIAGHPKVIDAFERVRDRIDLAAFFGEPMDLVFKLTEVVALVKAAQPFTASVVNEKTTALKDALEPFKAMIADAPLPLEDIDALKPLTE